MHERPLRLAAAGLALAMAALLVLMQFVLTPLVKAPTPLFLGFTAVWVFGAVMLVTFPAFGAAGTALYGVLVAWGFWSMHGFRNPEDVLVVVGSLGASVAAALALVQRLRARGA